MRGPLQRIETVIVEGLTFPSKETSVRSKEDISFSEICYKKDKNACITLHVSQTTVDILCFN